MLQTAKMTRGHERIYSFIGDAGAVSTQELATFLGEEVFVVHVWLRDQADAGFLHRDEFGCYGTSCHWPRVGF